MAQSLQLTAKRAVKDRGHQCIEFSGAFDLSRRQRARRRGKFVDFNNELEFKALQYIVLVPFIWTPIIQMLNLSLLSGNDYYWTKSILALNLIYFSRVINYIEKEVKYKRKDENVFGLLSFVFHVVHKLKKKNNHQ